MRKEITITYEHLSNWKDLADEEKQLVEKAISASENAYAPYSKFNVGAAALLANGEIVTGSNQENIAYPSGLCAERVTLFYAGANFPTESVESICIVAKGDLLPKDQILSPCGACRQVMMESESRQGQKIKVILVNQNEEVIVFDSVLDLLPLAFGVIQ
jgi:cytidine deaminase